MKYALSLAAFFLLFIPALSISAADDWERLGKDVLKEILIGDEKKTEPTPDPKPDPKRTDPEPDPKPTPTVTDPTKTIGIGDSQNHVLKVQGFPKHALRDRLKGTETWYYGSEILVTFSADGKVTGWSDPTGTTLKLRAKKPDPKPEPKIETFQVGDSKTKVLQIQGNPLRFDFDRKTSEEIWFYKDKAEVRFGRDRKVSSFNDPTGKVLQVVGMKPALPDPKPVANDLKDPEPKSNSSDAAKALKELVTELRDMKYEVKALRDDIRTLQKKMLILEDKLDKQNKGG